MRVGAGVVFSVVILASAVEAHAADSPPRICVVPLGDHEPALIPAVVRGIRQLYGLEVEVLDARPIPRTAWYQPRQRYRAEKLLSYLETEVVPGSGCAVALGFTQLDISTTKGRHADWGMLGMARIGGAASVISTHRMGRRVSRKLKMMRVVKVANHELGHALGLEHHHADDCVMEDVGGNVRTVDRESGLLCEDSRREVERRRGISLPVLRRFNWDSVL